MVFFKPDLTKKFKLYFVGSLPFTLGIIGI